MHRPAIRVLRKRRVDPLIVEAALSAFLQAEGVALSEEVAHKLECIRDVFILERSTAEKRPRSGDDAENKKKKKRTAP